MISNFDREYEEGGETWEQKVFWHPIRGPPYITEYRMGGELELNESLLLHIVYVLK